ncbi:MAG: DUF4097 family beta strand repeat protein, partial [Candidatus Eremiobacteraeota bacterium]|nr:DUF4097 family beta strand repeat protein [Candidatus Eremiobacteraeota bacterium]
MISRGTIIAALLVAELAIIGEAVAAVRAGLPTPWFDQRSEARTASGPGLIESGPHRIFEAGSHPALTVDIGHADLTILTSTASQIDVGVTASSAFGIFRATAPITAHQDGEAVVIGTAEQGKWKGDNRMVTIVVPPQTQVTVVDAGDIRASGLRADASFKSVGDGSITIDDYDAHALRVASSDGRILLQQIIAARLDATSSDGHVEASAL